MPARLFTRVLPAVAVVALAFTTLSGSASAIFPHVETGSAAVVTPPASAVQPTTVVAPVPPLLFASASAPASQPVMHDNDTEPPCETPEPTTIASALLGLGAVATAALRRKLA